MEQPHGTARLAADYLRRSRLGQLFIENDRDVPVFYSVYYLRYSPRTRLGVVRAGVERADEFQRIPLGEIAESEAAGEYDYIALSVFDCVFESRIERLKLCLLYTSDAADD